MSILCLLDLFYRYLIPIFFNFFPPLFHFKPILNVLISYFPYFFCILSLFYVYFLL